MAPSILLFYFFHGPLGAMEEWASFAYRLDPPSALCCNLENEKKMNKHEKVDNSLINNDPTISVKNFSREST